MRKMANLQNNEGARRCQIQSLSADKIYDDIIRKFEKDIPDKDAEESIEEMRSTNIGQLLIVLNINSGARMGPPQHRMSVVLMEKTGVSSKKNE